MAEDGSENIGGINVSVGADLSDLIEALGFAIGYATEAATSISTAFSSVDFTTFTSAVNNSTDALNELYDEVNQNTASVSGLSTAVQQQTSETSALNANAYILSSTMAALGSEVQTNTQETAQLTTSTSSLDSSVITLTQGLQQAQAAIAALTQAMQQQHAATSQANSSLSQQIAALETLAGALSVADAMKSFAEAALEAYGNLQEATIAIGALTGSAQQATVIVGQLKELALSNALEFDVMIKAEQHMLAFGVSAEKIPSILQAAANAARATGNDFSQVAQAIDRVGATGQAGARFLMTLGLTVQDLGQQLGVTAGEAQKAFRALDEEDRIDTLIAAMQKFNGVSQQVAEQIKGQWQDVKTQFEFVMQGIGQALAPVALQIISVLRDDIIPAIQSLIDEFNQLPEPVRDFTVVAVALAVAIPPIVLAFAGLAAALVTMSGALMASLPLIASVGAAIGAFAAPIAIVTGVLVAFVAEVVATREAITALTGVQLGWVDTIKVVGSACLEIINPLMGLITAYELLTGTANAAKAEHDKLAAAIDAARGKLPTATSEVDKYNKSLKGAADAGKSLADMHAGLSAKISELRENLATAQAALDLEEQRMANGIATANDVAKAYDAVTKAQKALTQATTEAGPPIDKLAAKHQLMRERLQESLQYISQFDSSLSTSGAQATALSVHIDELSAANRNANMELIRAVSYYDSLKAQMAQGGEAAAAAGLKIAGAAENVNAKQKQQLQTQEALNKAIGDAPDISHKTKDLANAAEEAANATKDWGQQLPAIAAYHPTLTQLEDDFAKQSRHIQQLAKTDLPAAIAMYDKYIDDLKATGAPLGEIYGWQEKLDQLQISNAEQSGADATQQIIDLTNLKEKTEALATASAGLGNVYAGLAVDFDKAFTEFGSQVADAIANAESFQKAWSNVVHSIAKDILNTLINGVMVELKSKIVDILSSMGGLAGAAGGALKSASGAAASGAGSAAGSAGQAAANTQFQTAVTQFTAAVTQDHTAVAQMQAAIQTFTSASTSFDTSTSTFDTSTGTFDGSTSTFDGTVGTFDTAVGTFDTAIGTQAAAIGTMDTAIGTFDAAVAAFDAATAASGTSSLLGGLLGTLFAFADGGDVPGTVLGLLHPQEMVLPAQYANVIRGLSSAGSGAVQSISGGTFGGGGGNTTNAVMINLNNPAFHGVSKDTLNDLMNQMVTAVRRSGARW